MPVAEKPRRDRFVRFAGITSVFSVLENGASLFGGGGPVFSSAPGKMPRNRFLSNIPCRYDDFLQEKAQDWIQDEKCCLFIQKGFIKLVDDDHGACYTNAV